MAAVLACGPRALLSHRGAATLLGLLVFSHSLPDVTAPGRSRAAHEGIVVHLPRQLHTEDEATEDGIPVTSVARTLLDLAEVVRPRLLERAVENAERLGMFDLGAVERLIDRSHGRRGLRALNAALRDYRGTPAFTRSELERLFLDLCSDAGLPKPHVNAWIAGSEVDTVWPDRRLVVELDSHEFHGSRAAFERDRIRDTKLQLAGYRVLRITHRWLEQEPDAVAAAVRSLLDRV